MRYFKEIISSASKLICVPTDHVGTLQETLNSKHTTVKSQSDVRLQKA